MVSNTVVPICFSPQAAAAAAAISVRAGNSSVLASPRSDLAGDLIAMADDSVTFTLPPLQARQDILSSPSLNTAGSPPQPPRTLSPTTQHPLFAATTPLNNHDRAASAGSSPMGRTHTLSNSPSSIAQQHREAVERRERKSTQLSMATRHKGIEQLRAPSPSAVHSPANNSLIDDGDGGRSRPTTAAKQDQPITIDFGLDLDGYGYNDAQEEADSHSDDKTGGGGGSEHSTVKSSTTESAKSSTVFSHFSAHLHLFSYVLLLAGLRQNTSRFYRNWLRVVTYGCLLMCFLNLFLQTKSYRNPLFDVTLVLLHILVSVSYEWWLRYCRSREWRVLMGIVTKVSSAHFARHIRLLGWFGLIMVSGATVTIVLGWEVPIFGVVAEQLQAGTDNVNMGKFAFLILHGVFMIVIIAPWAAVCMTSVCLFKLVVLAHQSDLEHHFLFIKHTFSKSLEQCINEQTVQEAGGISVSRKPAVHVKTATALAADLPSLAELRTLERRTERSERNERKKDVIADCFRFIVKHHQVCRSRLRATCHYFNWLYLGYLVISTLLVFSAAMDFNHYITLFPFTADVYEDSVAYSLFPHLVQDIFYMGLGIAGIYGSLYVSADLTSSFKRFCRRINDLPIAFPNAAFAHVSIPPATLAGLVHYYETSATAYTLFDTPITFDLFARITCGCAVILFFSLWLVNS